MSALIGHEEARALLSRLEARSLLFVGPERVGRKQVARWYAAFLNCQGEGRPCGHCESCRLVAADTHPDYREVAPKLLTTTGRLSRRPEIRIGQLVPREGEGDPLSRWLETPPRFAWRVGVIDSAQTLNPSAGNAFLKLLEEPPGHARIILIAPSPQAILPTLASRCTVLRFGTVALPASDHPAARLGRVGDLRSAEANPEVFGQWLELTRSYVRALEQGLEAALEAADALEKNWLNDLPFDPADLLLAELSRWPPERYAQAADALGEFSEALARYASPGLATQVLTLELRAILGQDRA